MQLKLDIEGKNGIIKENITNAAGYPVKINKQEKIKTTGEKPNSIIQTKNPRGGINRNYYDENGNQTKQISNNDHGHKAERNFGQHGEHAHDYHFDEKGINRHGKARNLTDTEREENSDIL